MAADIRWSVTRASGPTLEPVTTAQAKTHLRVEHSDDDTYIGTLVETVRELAEDKTGRAFVRQTLDYYADDFPPGSSASDAIELPRSPLLGVSAVYYSPATSTGESTVTASDYRVDTSSEPGRVYLKDGATWPSNLLQDANGVRVRFTAGYATTATGSVTDTPAKAKHAIKVALHDMYFGRGTEDDIGPVFGRLLSPLDAKRYQ